jgi:hypothetical protein
VTDDEGRRRFHGAFTGGFSAGYFNTVGSKEGWAPSTFVSSRAQRANLQQRPEDFMDDDDFSVRRTFVSTSTPTEASTHCVSWPCAAHRRRYLSTTTAHLSHVASVV